MIDEEDHLALFRGLAGVAALPDEVRVRVMALPEVNVELLLKTLPSVREAVRWNTSLDADAAEIRNRISDAALYGLELCSDALQRQRRFELPADDDVAALRDQVNELMESILDSSLAAEVKALLVAACRRLLEALQWVKISGVDGIEEAIAQSIGSGVQVLARFPDVARSDEGRGAMERFWEMVGRASNLTTIGTGAAMIATEVMKQLH